MPSLSLRVRLFGGSALLVVFSLLLAGFGVWQLASIDRDVGKLVILAGGSANAVEVGHLFERVGRLALHYKMTGNAASKDGSEAAQAAAIKLLDEAARLTRSPERREKYLAMEHGLADYRNMWASGVVMLKQLRDGQPKLLDAARQLADASSAVRLAARKLDDRALADAASATEQQVAALRAASLLFLLAPSEPAAETVYAAAAKLREALASPAPESIQPLVARARQALDAFAGLFATQSGTTLATNKLFNETMRPLVENLVNGTAASQASLRHEFDDTTAGVVALIGTTITLQKTVGLAALLLGAALVVVVGRAVIRPVAGMTVAMQKLAAGDTGVEIPSRDSTDEIGSMAKAVEVFRQNALDRIRLEAAQAEQQKRAAAEKRASMLDLANSFERSVGGIVQEVATASADMEKTATSMATLAQRASAQAGTVATAATEATGNVRMVASATEDLSRSIEQINQQVVRSTEMALAAVQDATRTDDTVAGLAEGARKIGDVVALIQTIAEQTNLLALNATIEAARAGDAGKGFAVVASEVKNLAGQTAKATQDIASQIAAIQSATKEAVEAIQGIGAKIGQMNDVSNSIAAAIAQQSAATSAIAGNVGQATRGTESVSTNIAGVTDASTEVGTAASEVLRAAAGMSTGSTRMKAEVTSFLATLRAA